MTVSVFTTRPGVLLPIFLLLAAVTWGACGDEEDGGNAAHTLTPSSEFPSLGMRLEVPPSVRLDEHVALKLTVENVTEAPVQFGIGGLREDNFVGGYDFVVTSADGSQVWHWLGSVEAWPAILSHVALEPGEQLRFEQEWPQADNRGRAVEPGTYLVRGGVSLETEEGQRLDLQTEATELVISP